jgi:hypothetical protein
MTALTVCILVNMALIVLVSALALSGRLAARGSALIPPSLLFHVTLFTTLGTLLVVWLAPRAVSAALGRWRPAGARRLLLATAAVLVVSLAIGVFIFATCTVTIVTLDN